MLLDIMAGTISAAIVPEQLRSRVSGAFMLVNNGVRPVGTTIGGILGVDDRRAPDAVDRDGRRAARARVARSLADPSDARRPGDGA